MANVAELKQRVLAEIDALKAEAEAIAADIHAHPETGWDTPRSSGILADYLERHGMEVERGVADLACAFRAGMKGRLGQHNAVCLLAEFDALPGLGHACSHNLIGTVASTAGIALSRVLGDVPGNVYVMGTPFEEGGGGKIIMIDKGVFDVADASLMFHGGNRIAVGSPNIAATHMTYKFYGKSAHAAGNPHLGINAADAAMITFTAVNALRQHVRSDVRIHGIITKGGDAANIVPDYAEVSMMVRALDQAYLEEAAERVNNCARAGALATGARLEIERGLTFAERIVIPELRKVANENLRLLDIAVPESDPQGFASADSGNVSYKMPHLTFSLPLDEKKSVPHTPAFAEASGSPMGMQAMITAAKIMATTAIDLLTDPEKLAAAKAQHQELLSKKRQSV
jgi:amidohydrolase